MELGPRQKAWIEKLNSGLEQGKGVLCNIDDSTISYCCLGVGCEVLIDFGLDIKRECKRYDDEETIIFKEIKQLDILEDADIHYKYEDDHDDTYLPLNLAEELGLNDRQGSIEHSEESRKEFGYDNLAEANDNGLSFEEITAFIKKYPETVFTKSI